MNSYVVYCHTDPLGKKYFGISKDYLKRWNDGKGYKENERFYSAICEYGWDNFEHVILKNNLTLDEANQIEKELIEIYSTTNPKNGYNLRGGGSGGEVTMETRLKQSLSRKGNTNCLGRVLSDETKNKISETLKEYYQTHTPTFLGKHHSQETIEKLKGKIVSEETRKKMRKSHLTMRGANNPSARAVQQFDLDGNFIKEYECATYASKTLNVDLSSLIKCCRGKIKSCGGFKWKYSDTINKGEVTS